MYSPAGARQKDISTRLIKPTLPDIDIPKLFSAVNHWDNAWEYDASIGVYDEGILQYSLTTEEAHLKFYAALILGKPSLRCHLTPNEPENVLDEQAGNIITLKNASELTADDCEKLIKLKEILERRGYRFAN